MLKAIQTPSVRFLMVGLLGLILLLTTLRLALIEPMFDIPFHSKMKIFSESAEMSLSETDFISEPGELTEYKKFNLFFERQDQIHQIVSSAHQIKASDASAHYSLVRRERHVNDLPALFWIQVIVGLGGFIISGWIWSLKSKDLPAYFFFLSGLSMCLSALTSAVYTTRNLFLPKNIFLVLEYINAWGASFFGMSIIALFLIYPKKTIHWKKLVIAECLIFLLWTTAFTLQWVPDYAGISFIIVLMMFLICIAIATQFLLTKNDPKSRASLLWLGLSVIVGAGAFVALNTIPLIFGLKPFEQGYAFLSFLVIYLGLAAGLKQFRLFEVGEWAFKFLFYAIGTIFFIILDAVFIFLIGLDRFPALGLALFLTGIFYLPLRDLFFRFFIKNKEIKPDELLREALQISFAANNDEKIKMWKNLLQRIFDPLKIVETHSLLKEVHLDSDGLSLSLPSINPLPALKVSYPNAGRSLFNLKSVDIAKQVIAFIKTAESNREAYERGVKEERLRMARDLHDDVSARLLTGLHSNEKDLRSIIQASMSDIRSIVKGITGEEVQLSELLSDLRADSHRRLQDVGIDLIWNFQSEKIDHFKIDYKLHKAISSIIREMVSNVIKHSGAKTMTIEFILQKNNWIFKFSDNGKGYPEEVLQGHFGFGLKSLTKKVQDIGGILKIQNIYDGSQVEIQISLIKN